MGARGPAPTPTATLEARGSWRAKLRDGEPEFKQGKPSCPKFLPAEAKAEWKRQVRALGDARILTQADRSLLAAYCEAWAEFVAACQESAKMDFEQSIALGILNAKNKAVDRLLRLAQQFGFSPAARTRIKAPEPEAKESAKDKYFGAAG